jgi:hypothetical protein
VAAEARRNFSLLVSLVDWEVDEAELNVLMGKFFLWSPCFPLLS